MIEIEVFLIKSINLKNLFQCENQLDKQFNLSVFALFNAQMIFNLEDYIF